MSQVTHSDVSLHSHAIAGSSDDSSSMPAGPSTQPGVRYHGGPEEDRAAQAFGHR